MHSGMVSPISIDSSRDIGVIALFLSIIDEVSFSMAFHNGGHSSFEISGCEASSDFFVYAFAIDA